MATYNLMTRWLSLYELKREYECEFIPEFKALKVSAYPVWW